jgi:radical SAM superfamily enzyme YgiQ (UPF0313 family)
MAPPPLRFTLSDARPATLLVGDGSTVLSVGDTLVSSWDLAGRPYALVRESGTFRRGLDGGWLRKREASGSEPRLRRRLAAGEGAAVAEAARVEAAEALAALRAAPAVSGPVSGQRGHQGVIEQAISRLELVATMDTDALARDAARFLEACGPVGILPPDQYLSVVVRVTEGCSWNECTFCSLYRQLPFRVKASDDLARHLAALREYLGASLALRRSVFLGDANALCVSQQRLLPLVEQVVEAFPGLPLYAFVDAWTGVRRTATEWRHLAALGLARVYVGLETGDPGLLQWLGKPGHPKEAADLVKTLREAGVASGVIVLLGAGGHRFDGAHVERTAAVLRQMSLQACDVLYFSEYVDQPGVPYAERAAGAADLRPLETAGCDRQRLAILDALGSRAAGPRVASYDLGEFVY